MMCLGIPMQLVALDGIVGRALDDGRVTLLDMSLLPDARIGDWVLAFLAPPARSFPKTKPS